MARKEREYGQAENQTVENVKSFAGWLVATVLGFGYWVGLLLIISLFLVNVWKVTWVDILTYAAVLAVITSIVSGILIVRRRVKRVKLLRRLGKL